MIKKLRKGEVFETNYTNLNDLPTNDGLGAVKQSTLPLPLIYQPIKNTAVVKRK